MIYCLVLSLQDEGKNAVYPPAFHDDQRLMEEDCQIECLAVCAGGQKVDELFHHLQDTAPMSSCVRTFLSFWKLESWVSQSAK